MSQGHFQRMGSRILLFFRSGRVQPLYPADAFFPQRPNDIVNDRFYFDVSPSSANPGHRGEAPLPTQAATAALPPRPASAPSPLAPESDVPHWLAPHAPPIDWASPLPQGANSDMGRSVSGSSAGDWLGLQQSDFGAFGKLPQGNLGKRSDLAPDSRDRSNTFVTNPLISMGLLRSSFDGNQAPLPTQAAPAPMSSPPQPSTELDAPHWLASFVSPMDGSSLPPGSDVPPWLHPGTLDKGLWRLLGFAE
jgi:hypothetical protein